MSAAISTVILSPLAARQARQRAQAVAMEQLEARGRVLFEADTVGTDPLDRAAYEFYVALQTERLALPHLMPKAPTGTYRGERLPRGTIRVTRGGHHLTWQTTQQEALFAVLADVVGPERARELRFDFLQEHTRELANDLWTLRAEDIAAWAQAHE